MCKTFTRHHRNHRKSKASPITSWYHLSLVLLAPWLTLQVAPETECGELGQVFFQRHSPLCSSSHPCAAWNVLSCLGKLSESEISSTVQTCSSGQELQGQQELNDESPVTSCFDISLYDYTLLWWSPTAANRALRKPFSSSQRPCPLSNWHRAYHQKGSTNTLVIGAQVKLLQDPLVDPVGVEEGAERLRWTIYSCIFPLAGEHIHYFDGHPRQLTELSESLFLQASARAVWVIGIEHATKRAPPTLWW